MSKSHKMKQNDLSTQTQGDLLREFRSRHGFTQMDLAEMLGYETPQFISNIEIGKAKIPLSVAKRLIPLGLNTSALKSIYLRDYKKKLERKLR